MEIRNAIEELGGDCDLDEDFSDDPLYRYLKGLDEEDEDTRRSPFEGMWKEEDDECEDDCDDDCHCHDDECDDDACHCHDDNCGHRCGDHHDED